MARNISRKLFVQWGTGLTGSLLLRSFPADLNIAAGDNPDMQNKQPTLRAIPASGERIPVIGMGTWLTFDAGNSETRRQDLKEVLRIFWENGGRLIDSSPMYGSSEKVVGDLVTDLKLKKFFLATKVWTNGEENGIAQMDQSFERMRTARMDLMQVHNLVDADTHVRTLRKWKTAGKIRYIGITHYQVSAYPELMELIKNVKPDFVQFNYNIAVREAEKRLLPFCADNGIAVINNRPFEGGGLFQRVHGKPLPAWAMDYGSQNWAQFFLKYIISHPAVTCAIPATSNPAHMQENIAALYGPMPDLPSRKKMADYFDKL